MSLLPPALETRLADALDTRLLSVTRLHGGMITEAARVETTSGEVFVKWTTQPLPDFFALEAEGLRLLREAAAFRIPEPLAFGDYNQGEAVPFLALEFVPAGRAPQPDRWGQRIAEALAALHSRTVSPFQAFGMPHDNYLGRLRQNNTPHADWPTFFRECRLLPQITMARQQGLLPNHREQALMRLVERLPELLGDFPARPCLLHGDLWAGNLLFAATGEPTIFDPAVYYGDREMEIIYIELFGGFPSNLLSAYHAITPLDPGYARRRPLHQLYHLLNHLNHFGEMYGPQVDAACRACA